jgi:hypothetical protein
VKWELKVAMKSRMKNNVGVDLEWSLSKRNGKEWYYCRRIIKKKRFCVSVST